MTKEQYLELFKEFRKACFDDIPSMTNDTAIKLFDIWYTAEVQSD